MQALLHELNNPERQLSTIVQDFEECGIDYCVIGSLAVRCHNYVRYGADVDVLVSKETYPKIGQFFIGNGYSYRPGSDRHLYCEFLGGRIPLDIYVEGEKREGGFPLPDPRASRIKVLSRWYASLPLLITLKIRADDLGDVFPRDHFGEAVLLMERTRSIPSFLAATKMGLAMAKVMNNEKESDLDSLLAKVDLNSRSIYEGRKLRHLCQILLNIDVQCLSKAEEWIEKAVAWHEHQDMKFWLGRTYLIRAELFKRKGDPPKARENLTKAIEVFKKCGADGWVIKAEEELARLS